MHIVLIIIGAASLAVILFWFLARREDPSALTGPTRLPSVLLAFWVFASAILGVHFFVISPPGFFDITIERILFSLILLVLLWGVIRRRTSLWENPAIEIIMAVFIIWAFLSMVRSGFFPYFPEFPSPWFVFITGYLFPFTAFVFAKHYIKTERDISVLLKTLFFLGIYLSVVAFFEFSGLRQYVYPRFIVSPDASLLHLERARGPFLNSAFNGVALVIGFICGLHLLQKKSGLGLFTHRVALLFFFPAVFFTLTRSVYVGMLIALIIYLGWYRTAIPKWRILALPIAFVLIAGLAYSPRFLSPDRRAGGVMQVDEVSIRFALMERSFLLFSQFPVTGVGLAQFIPASLRLYEGRTPFIAEEAGNQFQHNHLLGIATELGLPGLMLYLLVIITILRRLRQLKGLLPAEGLLGNNLRVVIFSIWAVYLANNLFVEPSNNLFVNAVPFIFAGIADGLYTRFRAKAYPALEPNLRSHPRPVRLMTNNV